MSEHLGSDTFFHLHSETGDRLTARSVGELGLRHGDTVYLSPDSSRIHRFDANGLAIV